MKVQKSERITYNRTVVGLRLKKCRNQLGWSRGCVAEKIGIVEKYYADIERGTCGMSIETMLALAQLFQLSLDELIYGSAERGDGNLAEQLNRLSPQEKEYCTELVSLFLKGVKEKI